MPWLVCTSGEDRGLSRETSSDGLVLGRAGDCDVQLMEAQASRYHCKVTQNGGKLIVEDMGSTNGIKYKGKRLKGKKVKLKEGESFGIGSDVFAFTPTHDPYLEASKDLIKDMGERSRSGVFEQTCSMAMNREVVRKDPDDHRGFFARLFGRK